MCSTIRHLYNITRSYELIPPFIPITSKHSSTNVVSVPTILRPAPCKPPSSNLLLRAVALVNYVQIITYISFTKE